MTEILVAAITALATIIVALIGAYGATHKSSDQAEARKATQDKLIQSGALEATSGIDGDRRWVVSTKKLWRRTFASIALTVISLLVQVNSGFNIWEDVSLAGIYVFGILSLICIFKVATRYFLIWFW